MTKNHKRTSTVLAFLVVAGALATGLGVQLSAASPAVGGSVGRPHGRPVAVAVVAVAPLSRVFGVFRESAHADGAQTGGQPLPSTVAEGMAQESASGSGWNLNPAEAKVLDGTYRVWIVPGKTGVCLVSSGVVGPGVADAVCGTVANAEAGRLTKTSATPAGEPVVVGLAPDGNAAVTVTDVNGSSRRASVTDNLFEIVGGNPGSVNMKGATGVPTTVRIGITPAQP